MKRIIENFRQSHLKGIKKINYMDRKTKKTKRSAATITCEETIIETTSTLRTVV